MLPIYRVGASQACYGCPYLENKPLGQKAFNSGGTMTVVFLAALSLGITAGAQDQGQKPPAQQDIPDAPSATRPVQPFPSNLPPAPRPQPGANQPPPSDSSSNSSNPPAMPPVKTVPPGAVPADQGDINTREDLYKIVTRVNY